MYNDCDINARCLMNDNRTKYQCVCNPGYDGDGKVCISRGRVNKTNVLIQVTVYQVFFIPLQISCGGILVLKCCLSVDTFFPVQNFFVLMLNIPSYFFSHKSDICYSI